MLTSTVELDCRLESNARSGVGAGAGVGGFGGVYAVNVGLMMFLVVESHDLLADMRLESIVGI